MRKSLLLICGIVICGIGVISLSAARSGQPGLRNSAATDAQTPAAHDLSSDYKPLHKGGIDLATGLYIRENEDLVVHGAPALILRRTYLSGYRVSKHFGIGATHQGEEYLIGDGERFQWASLILARGTRINFRRTTPGTSILNAQYVHDESASEWRGAQLRWAGFTWVLRREDGSTLTFKGCGPLPGSICSIIKAEDPDGHTIYYRRNFAGALQQMADGTGRWIGFDYDETGRIIRAHTSTGREVRYEYDANGRLKTATAGDGPRYRYTYTDLDQLATIEEPGTSIENRYADGRCVHQVNRYPDSDPYVFDFTYHIEESRIVRTETKTSDGTHKTYTWDEGRRVLTESFGRQGYEPIVLSYERAAGTSAVTALSVACPDLGGGSRRHTRPVGSGNQDRVKAELMRQCFH